MAPQAASAGSTLIKTGLSKAQIAIIWPGLNFIVCSYLTWQQTGQLLTSYPFRLYLSFSNCDCS